MNIEIKDLAIFSVALLIGYGFYPLIHQNNNLKDSDLLAVVPTKIIYSNSEDNKDFSSTSVGQSKTTAMEETSISSYELPVENHNIEAQKIENNNASERVNRDSAVLNDIETDPEQQILQQDLNNWLTEHKNNLLKNLKNNVPVSILDNMLKQVTNKNEFLNELSLKQDPIVDEQWAYVMEQQIRDVILQHPLANKLELFSVTCKQLTCELTGKELVAGTWQQVFLALFTHIVESGKTLADDNGKNISYQADGLIYFYSQFIFSGT